MIRSHAHLTSNGTSGDPKMYILLAPWATQNKQVHCALPYLAILHLEFQPFPPDMLRVSSLDIDLSANYYRIKFQAKF